MHKLASMTSALALVSLSLAGCNVSGALNAAASVDIRGALAVGCPILNSVKASGSTLNANQTYAEATLASACSPNPAPTTAIITVADVIAAYTVLQPLFQK